MHLTMRIALTLTLTLATIGCNKTTSDRNLRLVNVQEAVNQSESRRGILGMSGRVSSIWVDARNPAAFDAERIPESINLPLADVERRHRILADYNVIVVYDNDYGDTLARALSKRLIELGHRDVLTLRGGLRSWRDAGNSTVKGPGV